MASPISCNECRRRKIKCDKADTCCANCSKKGIICVYPSKFRSIEVEKLKSQSTTTNDEVKHLENGCKSCKETIRELEFKLALTEDFISIFDTGGKNRGPDQFIGHYTDSSMTGLEQSINKKMGGPQRGTKVPNMTLQKKTLPILIENNPEANLELINLLVSKFFSPDEFSYVHDLISKDEIFGFLKEYDQITDWKHDELMILLLVILIDSLKGETSGSKKQKFLKNPALIYRQLMSTYNQLTKMQPADSLNLIKAQCVLVNYYYYCYDFNSSWRLLFQMVSNAYSIGLHETQGDIWIKINVMECILCGVTSRPNILYDELILKDNQDPYGEIEFIEIMRLKNRIQVDSHIRKKPLDYDTIRHIDTKFDQYTSRLALKLNELEKNFQQNNGQSSSTDRFRLDKVYMMFLMVLSFQLNLHHMYFETRVESDTKTYQLLTYFAALLNKVVKPNELHKLRDRFAAFECLTYQFFLIYLKYLNFKSVRAVLVHNSPEGQEDSWKLNDIHQQVTELILKDPFYTNEKIIRVMELIKNFSIQGLSTSDIIKSAPLIKEISNSYQSLPGSNSSKTDCTSISSILNSPAEHHFPQTQALAGSTPKAEDLNSYYTSEDMKLVLEDIDLLNGLRDISSLASFLYEDNSAGNSVL